MLQADDQIGTRLYRLNYVKAADLQGLVAPLLTPEVGTVSISAPAEVGIAADNTAVGGDSFAGQEALLVRDYVSVLEQIDQVVAQIDRRPTQVAIEAMILSVKIDDKNSLGVDFELLRDRGHLRITSGSPLTDLASLNLDQGGFKLGFLDSSLGLFVNALESIGDTNVIATPRLMCLNKHRAQILIGSELGYVSTTQTETSTTQSVEFLEVGTQLRIRPFISSDGLIRMEVHPELSTGNVRVEGGFTLPDKELTEVTTNVVVRDGCTVILGGLMRDELSNSTRQIPYLGSMPLVGPLFRQTNEDTERREILILITPRIVYEPDTCVEGNDAASEFHFRHQVFADKMNPLGKRYLGRRYFRLAQNAWAAGRGRQALRLVNLAIHFDPQSRAAIDLRTDIWVGDPTGDHTIPVPFREVPPGSPIDGETVAPWLLERLQAAPGQGASHPLDAGRPGTRTDIIDPNQVR
jgi:type IV pilus assembly protein PilQ